MSLPTLQQFAAMESNVRLSYMRSYTQWVRQLSNVCESEATTVARLNEMGLTDQETYTTISTHNRQEFLEIWNNEPTHPVEE